MIKSMTAFSQAECQQEEISVACELRSYNSRHLDIVLKIPYEYGPLEERIKTLISEHIARGRIEVYLKIKELSEEVFLYEVNEPAAQAYIEALKSMGDKFGVEGAVTLEMLAGASGVLRPAEVERDLEKSWSAIQKSLTEALADLDLMRCREGEFIAGDFESRLTYIEETVRKIEEMSDGLLEVYFERLQKRIAVLIQDAVEIDAGRLSQEAALLADRSDITEEITRSLSHVEQFRSIMQADLPGGRKLNFLLQELNREFNTIGSKTANSDISHRVVEIKSELEKIREQVQNIE